MKNQQIYDTDQQLLPRIYFDPVKHQYLNSSQDIYISATQFIALFHLHFEDSKDFWALYKAVQYCSDIDSSKIKKYSKELDEEINTKIFSKAEYNNIVSYALKYCNKDYETFCNYFTEDQLNSLKYASQKIEEHWKKVNREANEKGTLIHKEEEDSIIENEVYLFNGLELPVFSAEHFDLYNLEVGAYPELRMFNHKYKLAGTSDLVLVLPDRKIYIKDTKTNKSLVFENKYQKMLAPIEHLDDCNFVHYNIQLSLYAWMLEQFGYECVGLEINYINSKYDGKTAERLDTADYKLEYLKEDIEKMLDYYGSKKIDDVSFS